MRWNTLKNSTLGYRNFRLGVAGFLLFFSLLGLSAQASISHFTSVETPIAPSTPAYPPGATLTEKLTMMLESWVTWYKTIYLPWSETDKRWKQELSDSWKNLSDSLKKAEAEKIALRLENESLRQQLKTARSEMWFMGLAGFGAGAGIAGITFAVIDRSK